MSDQVCVPRELVEALREAVNARGIWSAPITDGDKYANLGRAARAVVDAAERPDEGETSDHECFEHLWGDHDFRCLKCNTSRQDAEAPAAPVGEPICDHVNGKVKWVVCVHCGDVFPLCEGCGYDLHGHQPCDEKPAPVPVSDEAEAAWEAWQAPSYEAAKSLRENFLAGFRAARGEEA